jgi:hypothetical protein
MPRRRGRPGLVGTVGRTAVVAGTATAVSGSVAQRQQAKAQATTEHAPSSGPPVEPAASAPTPPQPAAPPAPDTMLAELERLVELKQQGLLTDDEFTALKARLIEG